MEANHLTKTHARRIKTLYKEGKSNTKKHSQDFGNSRMEVKQMAVGSNENIRHRGGWNKKKTRNEKVLQKRKQ